MTECRESTIRDLLPELLHGRLPAGPRTEVERHVAACAACRSELQLLQEVKLALDPRVQVDPAGVARDFAARMAAPPSLRTRGWAGARRLAAAAVVVLVAGSAWVASRTGDVLPDGSPGAESTAIAAAATTVASAEILFEASTAGVSDSELAQLARAIEQFDGLPAESPVAVVDLSHLPEVW